MGRLAFLSFGLLVVGVSLRGAKGWCPRDWLHRKVFCYKLFNMLKTWNDAEIFCRKHKPGCHLASIHSTEELIDVAEYVSDYREKKENVWIGLNDPQKVGPCLL
ncbi:C-type lectin lectoxin-Thr1-like [Crotalus tigris]|uniref:C-type lectin lectoxin-Thr1-like n=1 Tax=Crotalus tigris TaxID=88082 RepID=UPI00192F1204|nr:C-type lectin lectoxin-Thr1-like [Crotalus tigris]XP_039174989.1 C-type lectin lectoxin-Thr1-like [Crotalus tigris]